MRFLFILFVLMPIAEMWLLIKVGGLIGAGATILLVLLTAVIGAGLLRWQGISTLLRANQRLAEGQLPAEEIFEGLIIAVSGALLLTPGFFTDGLGFLGLIPITRRGFVKWFSRRAEITGYYGSAIGGFDSYGDGNDGGVSRHISPNNPDSTTIEGEFWKEK